MEEFNLLGNGACLLCSSKITTDAAATAGPLNTGNGEEGEEEVVVDGGAVLLVSLKSVFQHLNIISNNLAGMLLDCEFTRKKVADGAKVEEVLSQFLCVECASIVNLFGGIYKDFETARLLLEGCVRLLRDQVKKKAKTSTTTPALASTEDGGKGVEVEGLKDMILKKCDLLLSTAVPRVELTRFKEGRQRQADPPSICLQPEPSPIIIMPSVTVECNFPERLAGFRLDDDDDDRGSSSRNKRCRSVERRGKSGCEVGSGMGMGVVKKKMMKPIQQPLGEVNQKEIPPPSMTPNAADLQLTSNGECIGQKNNKKKSRKVKLARKAARVKLPIVGVVLVTKKIKLAQPFGEGVQLETIADSPVVKQTSPPSRSTCAQLEAIQSRLESKKARKKEQEEGSRMVKNVKRKPDWEKVIGGTAVVVKKNMKPTTTQPLGELQKDSRPESPLKQTVNVDHDDQRQSTAECDGQRNTTKPVSVKKKVKELQWTPTTTVLFGKELDAAQAHLLQRHGSHVKNVFLRPSEPPEVVEVDSKTKTVVKRRKYYACLYCEVRTTESRNCESHMLTTHPVQHFASRLPPGTSGEELEAAISRVIQERANFLPDEKRQHNYCHLCAKVCHMRSRRIHAIEKHMEEIVTMLLLASEK